MKIYTGVKKRVAVLFGGCSKEHEVSLLSATNIIQAIDREKYDITLIGIDKQGRWSLYKEHKYLINADNPITIKLVPENNQLAIVPGNNSAQLIYAVNGQTLPPIDVAFSVLHGASGEDGSVQGLLQILRIPYVGPGVMSSAICMDKDMTKRVLRDSGIQVTNSLTLHRESHDFPQFKSIADKLGLPIFVKPVSQGSSIGVSKVKDSYTFTKALELAFTYDNKIIIEQAIDGREIEIAVIGNSDPKVSCCGEIIVNDEFYTYDTKYLKGAQVNTIIPAQLPVSIDTDIREIARKAYLVLGCTVMARIDFFLTNKGELLLNEVNTLPGFTVMSMYPKLWKFSGLNYSNLVDSLIMFALDDRAFCYGKYT